MATRMYVVVTHLLELLDGTLVDSTALVDQICDDVSILLPPNIRC